MLSMSPRNKVSGVIGLESAADFGPALQRVHDLIHYMQGTLNIWFNKLV